MLCIFNQKDDFLFSKEKLDKKKYLKREYFISLTYF